MNVDQLSQGAAVNGFGGISYIEGREGDRLTLGAAAGAQTVRVHIVEEARFDAPH